MYSLVPKKKSDGNPINLSLYKRLSAFLLPVTFVIGLYCTFLIWNLNQMIQQLVGSHPSSSADFGIKLFEERLDGVSFLFNNDPSYLGNMKTIDEIMVTKIIQEAVKDGKCGNHENYMLDIGANQGYFGIMALAYGCKVEFFEPQPACHHIISNLVYANKFQNWAKLHMNFAASDVNVDENSSPKTITVGGTGCNVFFISKKGRVNNEGWQASITSEIFSETEILGVSIDDVVLGQKSTIPSDAKILIAKIDTEGSEVFISRGLKQLIKSGRVQNYVVEVSPPFESEFGLTPDDTTNMFFDWINAGYTAYMLAGGEGTPLASQPLVDTPVGKMIRMPNDRAKIKEYFDFKLKDVSGLNIWFRMEN